LTCKNHFLIFNIGAYFGLIIVLFNYVFSTAVQLQMQYQMMWEHHYQW